MTIRTLREFMEEGRKGAGTGSISDMQKEIGLLRAENLVLTRELTKSELCGGRTPQQVSGVLMCNAIRVDVSEIEDELGREVIATVAVDDECFDAHVKLSLGEDIDREVSCDTNVPAAIKLPVDMQREPHLPVAATRGSAKDDGYEDRP